MRKHLKILALSALTAIIASACASRGPDGPEPGNVGDQRSSGLEPGSVGVPPAPTSTLNGPARRTEEVSAGGTPALPGSTTNDQETLKKCIAEIAAQADDTVIDGWFFGQDPRMFKSFYRKIPAEQKAEFSLAYHDWIEPFKQDLVADFKTYVPYSKRADFAFEWWGKQVPRFKTQEKKLQVLWAHESIQDAGELWWRASEKLGKIPANSALTLAHDQEQKMVAHYMENEGSPGSLSDQVWKRTH